ncbi:hypothetical protein C0991_005951 [Blastosporella zonata]|nr:hypothetical protein C0991_005951 [Blastosporella zonata]
MDDIGRVLTLKEQEMDEVDEELLALRSGFMANSSGLRSPPPSRSDAASPRHRFDGDLLKAYMKKLLSSTLQGNSWPEQKDQERVKAWIKEIGERVKERMVEIQPRGL